MLACGQMMMVGGKESDGIEHGYPRCKVYQCVGNGHWKLRIWLKPWAVLGLDSLKPWLKHGQNSHFQTLEMTNFSELDLFLSQKILACEPNEIGLSHMCDHGHIEIIVRQLTSGVLERRVLLALYFASLVLMVRAHHRTNLHYQQNTQVKSS